MLGFALRLERILVSNFAVILRWLCALVVAIVVYTVVFALAAMIGKQFGSDPVDTLFFSIAAATGFGVIFGATTILPREKWKTAALALWLIALLVPLWGLVQSVLTGSVGLSNFMEFGGAVFGALGALYAVRVTPVRRINRVSGQNS
jgi:hypothetical protein